MVLRKFFLAVALILSACSSAVATNLPRQTSPPFTPSPFASETAPASTPMPTLAPTATMTFSEAIYPYTIAGLRAHKFQSGKIDVVGILAQTDAYKRYLIRYPSDGLTITGTMQIPAQGQPPFPVIVMDHGFFPRTTYISGDGTDRAAEFLNKHGYLTISPDYRSWGQADSGPSLFYSGLAIDVVNLLLALPSVPEADASRVGIWGHSMGGGVTIKVLTIIGDNPSVESRIHLRAAVLYSTVSADQSDVLARWGLGCFGDVLAGESRSDCNSSDVVPLDLPSEVLNAYYQASNDQAALEEVSPIFHLDFVDAPVQIHYGALDGRELSGTPPEWSKKLYQALLESDKPAKIFEYDGQRHSFIGDAWFNFMEEVTAFFDTNVKGFQ